MNRPILQIIFVLVLFTVSMYLASFQVLKMAVSLMTGYNQKWVQNPLLLDRSHQVYINGLLKRIPYLSIYNIVCKNFGLLLHGSHQSNLPLSYQVQVSVSYNLS